MAHVKEEERNFRLGFRRELVSLHNEAFFFRGVNYETWI